MKNGEKQKEKKRKEDKNKNKCLTNHQGSNQRKKARKDISVKSDEQ